MSRSKSTNEKKLHERTTIAAKGRPCESPIKSKATAKVLEHPLLPPIHKFDVLVTLPLSLNDLALSQRLESE